MEGNLVLMLIRVKMIHNLLSYFDNTILKIQPKTHDYYTFFFFFTELSDAWCSSYFCLNVIRGKTLDSWVQIEFKAKEHEYRTE